MRKIVTLLFLLIILVQVIGYYFAFRFRQSEIRKEVRVYLKSHTTDNNLTCFHLPLKHGETIDDRFTWENKNEFAFGGNMYDVIERNVSGSCVILYCLEDKKETELVKRFQETQKNESQQSKNRSASLLQIFGMLFLPAQIDSLSPTTIVVQRRFIYYSSFTIERAADILTPPPQYC